VQQYGGGAAVLPEIHVPEAHDIHVPAPVAPAFPVRRLPASVYVPEEQQQQQTDFELFNALNPHRARKPALGNHRYHCKYTITKIRNKYFQKRNCRPQSEFLHSCFCERFIYSHDRSAYIAAGK
jgi:hypothetical protein